MKDLGTRLSLIVFAGLLMMGGLADAGGRHDLEDVNFAFDSADIVDAQPATAALSELLNARPDLLITIKGHADWKGPGAYNDTLSEHRAQAVRDALVGLGVARERITVEHYGEHRPLAPNETYEGRWLNRRVVFDIYRIVDGRPDYYYRDNKFIKPFEDEPVLVIGPDVTLPAEKQPARTTGDTDTDHQGVLDRLSAIEKGLDDLKSGLDREPTPGPGGVPVAAPVPDATRFRILPEAVQGRITGSLGSDTNGHLTGRIEGGIFWPLRDDLAVQAGLSGLLAEDRDEYRFDLGVVGAMNRWQVGLFVQGLVADIEDTESAGTVSQVSATVAYRAARATFSLFATHPLQREDVINVDQRFIGSDLETTETYLRVANTYGTAVTFLLSESVLVDASLGYVNTDAANVTGHVELGHRFRDDWTVFLRGELNTARLLDDTEGRILAGLSWGRWRRPSAVGGVTPLYVPAVNYEVLTRTKLLVSDVNLAPVVSIDTSRVSGDAPLSVEFTGRAHDPDGTIESFAWNFGDGQSGSGSSISHTFTETGVYRVVLTATDDKGTEGHADVTIVVGGTNTPPVANAGADQTLALNQNPLVFICQDFPGFCTTFGIEEEESAVVLDASLSIDLDGDELGYLWRQIGGPSVVIDNSDGVRAGFTPREDVDAVYTFEVIVTDGRGGLDHDTVDVAVTVR